MTPLNRRQPTENYGWCQPEQRPGFLAEGHLGYVRIERDRWSADRGPHVAFSGAQLGLPQGRKLRAGKSFKRPEAPGTKPTWGPREAR